MIKTETEYHLTKQSIEQNRVAALQMREQLMAQNRTAAGIEAVMEPVLTFQTQFVEEVQDYERARAGDVAPIHNLTHIGQMLVGLRIARGLTQSDLAERLSVSESVVARDERNDYYGISAERAQYLLEDLEGKATLVVNLVVAPLAKVGRESAVV